VTIHRSGLQKQQVISSTIRRKPHQVDIGSGNWRAGSLFYVPDKLPQVWRIGIENVPRRGYRFAAPVILAGADEAVAPRRKRQAWAWGLVIAAALANDR
jgi:hypothetical protein